MNYKIPFNKPYQTGKELDYIQDAIERGKVSGNGFYTEKCQHYFQTKYGFNKCLLTNSCTDALEMAALLLDIQPGDEVIVPSFSFVSTANAFVLRGAKPVFVDSKSDHPGMDEDLVEELITSKTKAIVVVHYGGYPIKMDQMMNLAEKHKLYVIEDAAHAINQEYMGKYLGAWGHMATFSFHETKNIQCGEGGMLAINDPDFLKRAEIIWEKGTNRAAFFREEIDKYGWVDVGSSFLPSEITAAFLWAQLEGLHDIQKRRKSIWEDYYGAFSEEKYQTQVLSPEYLGVLKRLKFKVKSDFTNQNLDDRLGILGFSDFKLPDFRLQANAHIFYLIFPDLESRTRYAKSLKEQGVLAVFHYQSLHQSEFVKKNYPDQFQRALPNADRFSDCLLRLPLFYELPNLSKKAFA
ncbi:dTDP-4-amino-4,6-dideoxygalactose transaminase [Algoriphagus ornithinivorans]|uniref:dTDP-4-amino-4,6-dideoxygalactose transaminase n=1 Tax=Algoriphagus ornithinivorans TaxID=226506 RepID=A0A1I5HIS2_9BACT|nr:dTDP-4-amino-4,6-dideoxygalactose transaminase [Algoriphagus ornithinivorans]SFO48238.1 dTDP-4-amino-4,6-dideoxygalactose transaminase [Algoriphagus ornithinivorans]